MKRKNRCRLVQRKKGGKKKMENQWCFFKSKEHTKNFSGARQHDDKEKICQKFCCYDQKQQSPIFSHLLFFVAICYRNKRMLPECCPAIKENFLFRNFLSKSHSNVSKSKNVNLVTRGVNLDTTYVFASYIYYFVW